MRRQWGRRALLFGSADTSCQTALLYACKWVGEQGATPAIIRSPELEERAAGDAWAALQACTSGAGRRWNGGSCNGFTSPYKKDFHRPNLVSGSNDGWYDWYPAYGDVNRGGYAFKVRGTARLSGNASRRVRHGQLLCFLRECGRIA